MKCPSCNVALLMTERHGVEVDYCPDCRGIWLEKGILDRIVEKSASSGGGADRGRSSRDNSHDDDQHGNYDNDNNNNGRKQNKKGGFLGDLLDFG